MTRRISRSLSILLLGTVSACASTGQQGQATPEIAVKPDASRQSAEDIDAARWTVSAMGDVQGTEGYSDPIAPSIHEQGVALVNVAAADRVASVVASVGAAAEEVAETAPPAAPEDGGEPQNGSKGDGAQNGNAKGLWQGLGFGVGVSLTADISGDQRIESASLDPNGIVRVDKEQSAVAGIILESHYFGDCFAYEKAMFGLKEATEAYFNEGACGIGPFVAIQTGSDDVIDAIGAGFMIGMKRTDNVSDTSSLNLGIGVIVDPEVTVLGSGIEEDQALPAGEDEIRTKEQHQVAMLFLASFAF
ncbi:MAG: hypothetical protein OEU92_13525 [Alphaproteobacteria bacterium]|nr:hypothetical protein [Alphaproteobacteria bacterium]